jgi:hypothetical protein
MRNALNGTHDHSCAAMQCNILVQPNPQIILIGLNIFLVREHRSAGCSTAATEIGARHQLIISEFAALCCATAARISAQPAEFTGAFTAHAHELCCGGAQCCTFQREFNTFFHLRPMRLNIDAPQCCMITKRSTSQTHCYTILILIVVHDRTFSLKMKKLCR